MAEVFINGRKVNIDQFEIGDNSMVTLYYKSNLPFAIVKLEKVQVNKDGVKLYTTQLGDM